VSALADALGRRAVALLSARAGGLYLRIPDLGTGRRSLEAQTTLVRLVGAELASDLITNFALTRVYVPKGPSTAHNSRSTPIDPARVRKMTADGMSAQQIAQALQCSERTVYAKRANPGAPSKRTRP
jgi:DNA-binding NarL/FixJ family response regulator